jgi:hypothetical protein
VKRKAVFRSCASIRVLVVAGALAAAAGLAACGPVKMGAAATVGDERITTTQLDRTVEQWREEFDKDRQAALVQQAAEQRGQRIPFDPDSPHRSALYQLIGFKVWDEVAKEQGVAVTPGQVDRLLEGLGGQSAVSASVLAADVPLRYTLDIARVVLIQQELLRRSGLAPNAQIQPDPATQQRALQQRDAAYSAAARRLDITVNPRFGGFDARQVALNPVTYRLSKTESGTR